MLGGSVHKQNLRITDGVQVLSGTPPPGYDPPPAIGPLSSQLDSLYEARWTSLWSGVDVRYQMAAQGAAPPPMEWGLSLASFLVRLPRRSQLEPPGGSGSSRELRT
jgi:hypothetical protein